jgi:hypothetical protein
VTDSDRVPPRDSAPGEESAASDTAATALGEEAVLNAAMAFAGHVATAAQQASVATGESLAAPLRDAVFRQYLLETATLCLRRLGESYDSAAGDEAQSAVVPLLRDGATRAKQATATVEALGDLSLDILDRLLGEPQ